MVYLLKMVDLSMVMLNNQRIYMDFWINMDVWRIENGDLMGW